MTALLQNPGYSEEKLQRVAERLPCRDVQAGVLLSLMGQVGSAGLSQFIPILATGLLIYLNSYSDIEM